MKLKKSLKLVISAVIILIIIVITAKVYIVKNKLLYYQIASAANADLLVEHQILNLDNIWYYKAEDNIKFASPEYNDEKWGTDRLVYVSILKNAKSKTWLRKHFILNTVLPNDTFYLRVSIFDMQAELYVNGTKVADSGFIYNRSVCYYIPTKYLNKGKNLIALRSLSVSATPHKNVINFNDELFIVLKPTINLVGDWKFKTGDNMQWKNESFNDSTFRNIIVPKTWESEGLPNYDGYAWYRKKFTIPQNLQNQNCVYIAGKIDDYGEIFINGIKIGGQINYKTGPNYPSDWDTRYYYLFDRNILKDTNTIAVRVLDLAGLGGIYEGPVGIMSQDDFIKFIEVHK